MEFYPLKIIDIEPNTPDCILVTLGIPDSLEQIFKYQAGQYLTMKIEVDGKDIIRHYSICASPLDNSWRVGIKRIAGGKFSSVAHDQWETGDEIMVSPPTGKFCIPENPDESNNYIAYAAGSGITPTISIISTLLRGQPKANVKLFYVNKTSGSIILKEELEALKNQFMNRLEIFYFLTSESRSVSFLNGRITPEKLDVIFKILADINHTHHHFICGPEAMLLMVRAYLLEHGVSKEQIHFELFHSEGTSKQEVKIIAKEYEGEVSKITLIEGGKSFKYVLPSGSNNILDGALALSADLPFACKGGVCCTCRAKLIEGEVKMMVHYGLEDDEIEAGYILTCQAIPVSEKILIDYDA